ncbi:sigma-54 dependent transcriptional regulator [Psychrobacter sp. 16-MNA-CIBAN-0192]|uniref:sigma-54-dependent transcriptional regulator n=1 Tax=Psychrobacter sp. 16-MNA-CIBAN-0192 TaxID=3140448 RepID=UPI003330EAF9
MTATALIVDDEADLCRLMQITLTKIGIKSDVAYSLAQAQAYWKANSYDFCLTDLNLPDGSGLDLVKQVSSSSSTPIAVITAHGSMDLAIEALKLGAFDFVNKPLELPRLRQLVESALKVIRQDNDTKVASTRTPEQQLLDSRLIGHSAVMQTLKGTILKLARSQAPVFLSGASGTGKEVVARLIHDLSARRDGCFVPVNCGAIPSELMESEFFGHKKGSFTGAVADKQGLFQQASGGTLFLDEVADLPLAMQVKLLRAIQEKTVRAIGDTREIPVDIRILSATHKDLNQLVQSGAFRQDLYYRINVIELTLPTLMARYEDIPVLAQHFLALIAEEWQLEHPAELSPAAYQRLQQHNFAGNVRELRNILERAITLSDSSVIEALHLGLPEVVAVDNVPDDIEMTAEKLVSITPASQTQVNSKTHSPQSKSVPNTATQPAHPYTQHNPAQVTSNIYSTHGSSYMTTIKNVTPQHFEPTLVAAEPDNKEDKGIVHAESSSALPTDSNDLPKIGLEAYLQAQEERLIIKALKQTNGNKTQAAELLGTTFRSLRYRMKKLEIDEN